MQEFFFFWRIKILFDVNKETGIVIMFSWRNSIWFHSVFRLLYF